MNGNAPRSEKPSEKSQAVRCLRQAIAVFQDLPEDSPVVRDQAAILVNLIKWRHVEVVKGRPEVKEPWLRLAMDLEADEVDVHIRLTKGKWLAAGVNHVHK